MQAKLGNDRSFIHCLFMCRETLAHEALPRFESANCTERSDNETKYKITTEDKTIEEDKRRHFLAACFQAGEKPRNKNCDTFTGTESTKKNCLLIYP